MCMRLGDRVHVAAECVGVCLPALPCSLRSAPATLFACPHTEQLALDEGNVKARVRRAVGLSSMGRHEEAVATIHEAQRRDPINGELAQKVNLVSEDGPCEGGREQMGRIELAILASVCTDTHSSTARMQAAP